MSTGRGPLSPVPPPDSRQGFDDRTAEFVAAQLAQPVPPQMLVVTETRPRVAAFRAINDPYAGDRPRLVELTVHRVANPATRCTWFVAVASPDRWVSGPSRADA